jgi:hypothetical protein
MVGAARNPKREETTMRFMVIVKANDESEAGGIPDKKLLTDMGKYNEELVKAGVLLAAEGLHPSSKGLIAGFWLFQVKSLDEAIEWVKRAPNPFLTGESEIEIRQVFEADDFGPELTPEVKEYEERLGKQMAANAKR